MTLSIDNRRTKSASSELDDLVTIIKLKKGDRASLALHSVSVEVEMNGTQLYSQSAPEVVPKEVSRNLNLTPGEETHFAFVGSVPSTANCKVIATVTGKTLGSRFAPFASVSIWKASEISCPISSPNMRVNP
jgi:hypothetical protein